MPKPLTESVLKRLTTEALVSFLGQARDFEARLRPGADMVICHEPVADLNYVVVGKGPSDYAHLRSACRRCLDQDLPFLALVYPEAGAGAKAVAEELGLVYAVDFPIMVREDQPIEPSGNEEVQVEVEDGTADALSGIGAVSAAFHMPEESTLRVMPPALVRSPGLDVYVARLGGEPVGSVTVSHHGDTSGIWAMATDPDSQKRGVGRKLLSSVLAECRDRGTRRFFLGATPAGFPLYEKLGFETRVVASVWVSGETSQS